MKNNLPNHDLSFLLKSTNSQTETKEFDISNFLIKDIPNISSTELENDKKIFENSKKNNKNDFMLDFNTYNQLSKQTRHELSKYTTYRGDYVCITKNPFA